MKKIVLFSIIALFSFGAKAQTFDQTQEQIESQSAKLEKELKEAKDRIFYLEVSIPDKIMKSKNLAEIQRLKNDAYFSKDEVVQLRAKKVLLESAINELTKTSLESTEYRTKADLKSNLPERMNQREYAQRVRSNDLKSETNDGSKFVGILVNHKLGQGEIATIVISRKDIKGLPPIITEVLLPGQEIRRFLPAGEYVSTVSCGSFCKSYDFFVRPGYIKGFEGKDVYWDVWKAQNDF